MGQPGLCRAARSAWVLAGDLVTLVHTTGSSAISSSIPDLVARRTPASYRAGMRYLIVQVISGLLLLSGIILHARAPADPLSSHNWTWVRRVDC